eukprot:194750-Prorocentrum_minimum.AAC.5
MIENACGAERSSISEGVPSAWGSLREGVDLRDLRLRETYVSILDWFFGHVTDFRSLRKMPNLARWPRTMKYEVSKLDVASTSILLHEHPIHPIHPRHSARAIFERLTSIAKRSTADCVPAAICSNCPIPQIMM